MAAELLGPSNHRVKRLRRLLARRRARAVEQVIVVEGPQMVAEALAGGLEVEGLYVEDERHVELVAMAAERGVPVHRAAPGVLARALDTVTPQPVAAICARPQASAESLSGAGPVVLVVEGRDPGNIGTIIRSAEAAGAAGVVLAGSSVDPTNPKALRASAGAGLRLPVVAAPDLDEALAAPPLAGRRLVAMVVGSSAAPYDEVDLRDAVIAVGNEAHGLPAELLARADTVATIPLAGPTESLNLAVAAAVVCFEALRQRRTKLAGNSSQDTTGWTP